MLRGPLPCSPPPAGGSAHPSATPGDGSGARLPWDLLAPEQEKGEEGTSAPPPRNRPQVGVAWRGFAI